MKAAIIGASGYTGADLIRILDSHPDVEISAITSRKYIGKSVWKAHPSMRNLNLRFTEYTKDADADVIFLALPHTASMEKVPELLETGVKVIDLSADFRLKDLKIWEKTYGAKHTAPNLIEKAVYGLPELHREEIKKADFVSGTGCEATAGILALAPLQGKADKAIIDVKVGGSAAGSTGNAGTHYPARAGNVRPYSPSKHRHQEEIKQETGFEVSMTAHAVDLVRGILATCHIPNFSEDVSKLYRDFYKDSPFIRITPKDPKFLPNPKYVVGSNYCDIGIVTDEEHKRTVVFSAIDNLVKGASGQAIQCMNLMFGLKEETGLEALPLYPA
ncbi:TPA: N-acetyl-gamma-glutamyl-phosphate reductase [archaeon]|nr:N-acetyl-gamma-glutamyl-phosphate reductase [Candidatus Undinarchaeales archaeon SRR5007147.bin71]